MATYQEIWEHFADVVELIQDEILKRNPKLSSKEAFEIAFDMEMERAAWEGDDEWGEFFSKLPSDIPIVISN